MDLIESHMSHRAPGERLARTTVARSRAAPTPAAAEPRREPAERKALAWQKWTPAVSAETVFVHLFGASETSFWLDSSRVIAGMSRFSFMADLSHAAAQRIEYRCTTREVSVRQPGREDIARGTSLFDFLRQRLSAARIDPDPALPFDFCGGFVGSLGYELKDDCGGRAGHVSELPDACLLYVERFLAFDHETQEVYAVALPQAAGSAEADAWIAGVRRRIEAMRDEDDTDLCRHAAHAPAFTLEKSRTAYIDAILRCQDMIADGQSYEVCLTNRIRARADVEPLSLYRTVRRRNPAPYAAYLRLPGAAVICSSPERFLKIGRDRVAESRPVKGTARRDPDPAADRVAADALRASEKNRCENLMIVDLMRNDLGRVSAIGSVRVPELMAVESHATVHQLVSTVQGTLRDDMDAIDCVRAAFPGGSMTGAPKVRTMEIIDALEDSARGIYSGAIGYLSLNGTADLNVVIRTIVAHGGELSVGVGGAIVAQSDPQEEFVESMLKGDVLLRAIASHVAGAAAEGGITIAGSTVEADPARAPHDAGARAARSLS